MPFASSNGVISQAKTWKQGLEQRGHEIVLIDVWHVPKWTEFDAIVYFGFGGDIANHMKQVSKINKNVYVAPIIDPGYNCTVQKIYSYWGAPKIKLTNPFYMFRTVVPYIKGFLVRSNFEMQYMTKGFGADESKCHIVPLSFNHVESIQGIEKEDFCLHISFLADKRKNVKRLIDAAKKYKFKLVLGGKLRNQDEERLLENWVGGSEYIEYKGFLTEEEKNNLYARAKVFALPSINEGVGIVGLEAASLGCDIVVTSIGGPKEYYNNLAKVVNPYSVDEIGKAVQAIMTGDSNQPRLANYVNNTYSLDNVSQILESVLAE